MSAQDVTQHTLAVRQDQIAVTTQQDRVIERLERLERMAYSLAPNVTIDPWHIIGAAGEPAFQGGTTAYGAPFAAPAYRKDPNGRVYLRGLANSVPAAGGAMFTLPAGYRPPSTMLFDAIMNQAAGRIDITAAGVVSNAQGATGGWAALDGISFDTETVSGTAPGPLKGDPGPTGLTGPKGDQGVKGDQGIQGPQGVLEAYQQPAQPTTVNIGALWLDTDETPPVWASIPTPPRLTTLPSNPSDGQECYLVVDASSGAYWHMRYNLAATKWECMGGNPIIYGQEGANSAYVTIVNGDNITVNAAKTQILQWLFTTPAVPCWAEVYYFVGLMQKMDAAYHYCQPNLTCSPAPVSGTGVAGPYIMQYAGVQTFEGYQVKKIFALAANTAYTFRMSMTFSGGTWQYNQGAAQLFMNGKAWAR